MAIQKDTEYIGKVENLIYYKWLEIYCIRTVPKKPRQTNATKGAAKNFGLVSSRSKILRGLLEPLIADPRDKAMQVRLKKALLKTLTSIGALVTEDPPLLGFRFNDTSPLGEILRFPIQITEQPYGKIKIEIPSINPKDSITAPAGTTAVQLGLMTVSFSFDHERLFRGTPEILSIPFTEVLQPAVSVELESLTAAPCILLVIAAISYWNEGSHINKGGNNPVEVVRVYYKE